MTKAASSTSKNIRAISHILKTPKGLMHPLVIAGGLALGYILGQVADYIDETPDDINDEIFDLPQVLAKKNSDIIIEKDFSKSKSKLDIQTQVETQEDTHPELPTVVIVHGFISSDKFHSPMISPLTKELIKRGFPIYIAKVSKIKFAAQQAKLLHQEIETFIPKDKEIILLGHSLGGLISRQYAFKHWKDRIIKNVISIGTPHWGVNTRSRMAFVALQKTLHAYKGLGSKVAAKILQTTKYLEKDYMNTEFNNEITNIPGVDYLSVMTVDKSNRINNIPDKPYSEIIDPFDEHVSDGLVPVKTSMWTKMLYADKCVYEVSYDREIRGPLYNANHITQISTLSAPLSLKNNAYRLGKDLVNYILASLKGGYINPAHCSPF